jgi:hypothetical protein
LWLFLQNRVWTTDRLLLENGWMSTSSGYALGLIRFHRF